MITLASATEVIRAVDDVAARPGAIADYLTVILAAGGVMTLAGFILLKVLAGRKIKIGGAEIEMTHDQASIDDAIDALIFRKNEVEMWIRNQQKRRIQERYDDFMDVFQKCDFRTAELMWRHFCDPLIQAADENHVLSYLDKNEHLEDDYVENKVFHVQRRHRRLRERDQSLPEWSDVEVQISCMIRLTLEQFAEIAKNEWTRWKKDLESIRLMVKGNEQIERRLKRL